MVLFGNFMFKFPFFSSDLGYVIGVFLLSYSHTPSAHKISALGVLGVIFDILLFNERYCFVARA